MPPRAIVFDLFHTLTGLESEWCNLPWTSDVLGIDRAVWNTALTVQSRWRVAGEERDPYRIVERLARAIDPSITDETLRIAVEIRIARFRHSLIRVPPANVETLRQLRAAGFRLGLISNADVMEVAAWADSPLAGLFDVEVFSCTAGCVKPEPAIFARCLDALDVAAAQSMWKVLFIAAALSVSASPLDAAQPDNGRRIEKTQRGGDLRRDVDRISKEIYRRNDPPPRQPPPPPQRRR